MKDIDSFQFLGLRIYLYKYGIYRKVPKTGDVTPSCAKANVGWCTDNDGYDIN